MNDLSYLRRLVEYKNYQQLKNDCLELQAQDIPQNITSNNHKTLSLKILLAIAYIHLGDKSQFDAIFSKISQHITDLDHHALCDLASIYMLQGEIKTAIELLQSIINQNKQHDLALARLGWCYLKQQEFNQAVVYFSDALAINPNRIIVYIYQIPILLEQSLFEPAQKLITQALLKLDSKKNQLPQIIYQEYFQQINLQQLSLWIKTNQYVYAENWLEENFSSKIENKNDSDKTSKKDTIFWTINYANLLAENDQHQQALENLLKTLKIFPDSIELLIKLSEISNILGYIFQSINFIKKALTYQEDNLFLWTKLAMLYLPTSSKDARESAQKAIDIFNKNNDDETDLADNRKTNYLLVYSTLAIIESNEQNYDQAEKIFLELLTIEPNYIPVLQHFGQQKLQQGKIGEAIDYFNQLKQIDPVKGHSALIGAKNFPKDNETLEKLENIAHSSSLEGSIKSSLLFQIASAREKQKDYKKAFELLIKANQHSRQSLHYDPQKHRRYCARIRYAFSKSLYKYRKGHGNSSNCPIFIVGMPRSGTSLIEQILSGHSQIFGAGELNIIPQVIARINRWERHVGSGRKYPDCIDDIPVAESHQIASMILDEIQHYAPDASHIIDKLPHNFENIGLIKFLFPKAKIISVRRDPRDIAISNYFTDYMAKHGGMGFAYNLADIGEQLADHNFLIQHWQKLFADEILEIQYENLIDNTEKISKQMFEYIGVNWEQSALDFYKLERPVKTASVWQVRQPIYKTSKARWEHYRDFLAPLIKGTNKSIKDEKMQMITLPTPGLLFTGIKYFKEKELDKAEENFKKLLHHIPEHAAANFMLGTIYIEKGYHSDGIELMEQGLKVCPWNKNWKHDLKLAYKITGIEAKNPKIIELDQDDQKAEQNNKNDKNNTNTITPDYYTYTSNI
ncbi:MAG: sulfotransferase [Gammaproteobacteria bacterium]|nr:sulfotransferase [Gammaproteobacteria bacterium]